MDIAKIPSNETERLTALYEYKILDTPCEEIFDTITKLAAAVCAVPICLISLVDRNRQFLKSNLGLEPVNETSRDVSFCAHTILGTEVMEVPDATQDKRFHDNPLVLGDPKIRFYAGAPLSNQQGFNLGTLCVIDRKTKILTKEQKEILRKLSKIVMTLLESKKAIANDVAERIHFTDMLKNANDQLQERLAQQDQYNHTIMLFSQMNGMLQSCFTEEEAYYVIHAFAQQVFPEASGTLYLMHSSRDYLEPVTIWKSPRSSNEILLTKDCWGLRRGQHYCVDRPNINPICKHFVKMEPLNPYICLPLTAQGETFGLLCLEPKKPFSETERLFTLRMAEQIASSLANIKLRQSLRQQSIRDPLTGLYNRRYLAEIFHRELPRAHRNHTQLGLIIIDVDHFKRFNDTFGHDAGDLVLQKIALLMQENIQEHDLACRFGGEEFLLLLRDTSLEEIKERAEKLRKLVRELQLQHAGKSLGTPTISLGIALYPKHGNNLDELITAADKALYQAKETGRDKVIISDSIASKNS